MSQALPLRITGMALLCTARNHIVRHRGQEGEEEMLAGLAFARVGPGPLDAC